MSLLLLINSLVKGFFKSDQSFVFFLLLLECFLDSSLNFLETSMFVTMVVGHMVKIFLSLLILGMFFSFGNLFGTFLFDLFVLG